MKSQYDDEVQTNTLWLKYFTSLLDVDSLLMNPAFIENGICDYFGFRA